MTCRNSRRCRRSSTRCARTSGAGQRNLPLTLDELSIRRGLRNEQASSVSAINSWEASSLELTVEVEMVRLTRTRARLASLVAIGAVATLGLAAAPALADSSPAADPDAEVYLSPDEALLLDAGLLAEDQGIPLEAAVAQLEAQTRASQQIEEISRLAGDRLGGWWTSHEDGFRVSVSVTPGPPIEALDKLATSADYSFDVSYTARFTEQQLVDAANAVGDRMGGRAGFNGVGVDYSTESLFVAVVPELLDEKPEELVAEAANTAKSSIARAAGSSPSIEIALVTDDGVAGDLATVGGVKLVGACSSAFAVRTPGGTRGFLTAGHCANYAYYALSPSGSPTHPAPFHSALYNGHADLQMNRPLNHTVSPSFFGASATTATTQSGSLIVGQGNWVCKRGAKTGYTCGYVQTTSYNPGSGACGTSTCQAAFIRVAQGNFQAAAGDSGGAGFVSGSFAFGVLKCGVPSGGTWACFTKTQYLGQNYLNVQILTS